jgi:uncharacterized protein YktB (UPF0637 family)
MTTITWSQKDFDVFQIDGLDARMHALTEVIRPKFHALGDHFSPFFSAITGDEFFTHVAKHARRTINPPKDSWVALAPYKRGYKALPHFQIGLWGTHLFIVVAVIYEAPNKKEMAERLLQSKDAFKHIDATYSIAGDHMAPQYEAISLETKDAQLESVLTRLRDVKKGEFLIGRYLTIEEASALSEEQFMALATETFETLLPIYNVMANK